MFQGGQAQTVIRGARGSGAAAPRYALCGEDHQTADHRCPAERCRVRRGYACACGGQVHEMRKATPLPGQRVPSEEGGPPAGQGVEVTLHTTEGAYGINPSRNGTPCGPVTGMGDMEVERQPGAEA